MKYGKVKMTPRRPVWQQKCRKDQRIRREREFTEDKIDYANAMTLCPPPAQLVVRSRRRTDKTNANATEISEKTADVVKCVPTRHRTRVKRKILSASVATPNKSVADDGRPQ